MCQKHKRVPLARCVRLGRQERLHEFWSIGYEVFEFAVDSVYCKDGVFADVGVAVFEAGATEWDEGFEKFGVPGDFLKEAQGCAPDIFIRVLLEVIVNTQAMTKLVWNLQDHFILRCYKYN